MRPKQKPNTCLVSVFFDLPLGQVTKTNKPKYFQFGCYQTGTPVWSRDQTEIDRPTGTRAVQHHPAFFFSVLTHC
jgi:hypothetical protein